MASTPEVRKAKRKFVKPRLIDYGKLDRITMTTGPTGNPGGGQQDGHWYGFGIHS